MKARFARLAVRAQAKGYLDYGTEALDDPIFKLKETEILRVVEEDISLPVMSAWAGFLALRSNPEDGDDTAESAFRDIWSTMMPWLGTEEQDDDLFKMYEELGKELEDVE